VISCLGSSLVNRVVVARKVKTVGFDLVVVQPNTFEPVRTRAFA
jgi:hypothetical protein